MSEPADILVVGSINMDLVIRASAMPQPGQTVMGDGFSTNPGGKGANQAVAASRLGGNVAMVGLVGDDTFGATLRSKLKAENVDCMHVKHRSQQPTGVAMIVVDSNGENSIVVSSGANALLTPDDIFPLDDMFAAAKVVVLQLELPLPTVRAAIEKARFHKCKVILDPAPMPRCLPDALCKVDIFSPNVTEAETMTGCKVIEERVEKNIALEIIQRGAQTAVLKLGSRGSMIVTADGHFYKIGPYKVSVVDTTAAGDAFTAALAVATAEGLHIRDAARLANAAGALACTRIGAQAAMPTRAEVDMLMDDQKPD
ncbi:MAG: ribokinase [Phycisphaerae bacterium]